MKIVGVFQTNIILTKFDHWRLSADIFYGINVIPLRDLSKLALF